MHDIGIRWICTKSKQYHKLKQKIYIAQICFDIGKFEDEMNIVDTHNLHDNQ